jgi:hypothetical protein
MHLGKGTNFSIDHPDHWSKKGNQQSKEEDKGNGTLEKDKDIAF